MKLMGKHSPPVDGIPVVNGHTLVPLTVPQPLQVTSRGPADVWPQRQDQADATADAKSGKWHVAQQAMTAHRGWLAAVPIVLVNSVAFAGQLAFLRHHLPWILAGQILVAVTLESVAVYLAWQAHLALAADDSALRLRLAAYSFAAVIGTMNFSHYAAPHWRPTFAAVTFGLMSLSSPWLWSVHSRRASRDALKAAGLIEPHAVRLGANRWLWHPVRSWRVMFRATWAGETDPARAIALPPSKVTREAPVQVTPEAAPEVTPESPADVTSEVTPEAARESDAEPPADVTPSQAPSQPETAPARRRQVTSRRKPAVSSGRISDADLKELVRVEFDADPAITVSAAAKKLVRSRDRIRPLLEQVRAEASANAPGSAGPA